MSHKSLMVHGGWFLAAVAAFVLGGQRQAATTDNNPSQSASIKRARAASGLRDSGIAGVETPSGKSGLRSPRDGKSPRKPANFEHLARQAASDPDPLNRRLAFARILESLTAENAIAIREQLVAAGTSGDDWRDFNYRWGALGGREVVEFAAVSEERDMNDALTGWASADPTGAMAMLADLPENMKGSRDSLTASVVEGISHQDPALATDFVLRLAADGNRHSERLIDIVARQALRADGHERAAAWSETLPDGPVKAAAMDRVADTYVRKDPEAAARWAQAFATEEYAARAIEEVGDGLARRDPVAAADWLGDLPAGRGQNVGLQSVFGDWEDRDPVAAGEYLMKMPQSAKRDSAISGFSRGYAWQDPQTAIAWAEDISDPGLRRSTLTSAGQAFFRRDPKAAKTWLANADLPPEAKKAIQNPPRRR